MNIKERDILYNIFMNCRNNLKLAEEHEIRIKKEYSEEKYDELLNAEEEVRKKTEEYVKAKAEFLKYVRE